MPRKKTTDAKDVEDVLDKLAPPTKSPSRRASKAKPKITPVDETELDVFPKLFLQPKKKRGRHFHKPNSLIHNHPQQVMTPNQQKISNIFLRHVQLHGMS